MCVIGFEYYTVGMNENRFCVMCLMIIGFVKYRLNNCRYCVILVV